MRGKVQRLLGPTRECAALNTERSFAKAADCAGLTITLAYAVERVNAWRDLPEHSDTAASREGRPAAMIATGQPSGAPSKC
jgi:hypothetical protein